MVRTARSSAGGRLDHTGDCPPGLACTLEEQLIVANISSILALEQKARIGIWRPGLLARNTRPTGTTSFARVNAVSSSGHVSRVRIRFIGASLLFAAGRFVHLLLFTV